jgi:hypothetical protein
MVRAQKDLVACPAEERSVQERLQDFSDLIDRISTLGDKKKSLWAEIYRNAITDRTAARSMFTKLESIMAEKTAEHAVHGKTAAAYLERMNKANDQLLKLAELVARAEAEEEAASDQADEDELYKGMTHP